MTIKDQEQQQQQQQKLGLFGMCLMGAKKNIFAAN